MSKLQGAHITFFLLRHLWDRNLKRGVIDCLLFINDTEGVSFPIIVPEGFIHTGPACPSPF